MTAVIGYGPVGGEPGEPRIDMKTWIGDWVLPSPIMTASGCSASGKELDPFFDLTRIGAVVTKSVMLAPRSGRATPRMAETPSGMLNSIGLQGPGIEAFVEKDLPWLRERGVRAVVSIAGGSVEEYGKLAQVLRYCEEISAVEVNISCPNVADRGQVFACDAKLAAEVVSNVRRIIPSEIPVIAKLSPDVTDIVGIAYAVVKAGATGLSLINTTLGMVVDTETLRPALAGVTGGLSGPAIRPIAVRCVWQVHEAMPDIPIIGIGGIGSGLDALQFILAGASAVQVGTMTFNDPSSPQRVHTELARALAERGFGRFTDAIGYAHRPHDEPLSEFVADAWAEDDRAGEGSDPARPLSSGAAG